MKYTPNHKWDGEQYHLNASPQFTASLDVLYCADSIFTKNNLRVLDLGCGTGLIAEYLLQKHPNIKQYVGVDANASMLEKAQQILRNDDRFIAKQADMQDEEMAAALGMKFDVIIAFWSLHWAPNLETICHTIAKLLDKNGAFICINRLDGSKLSLASKQVSTLSHWQHDFQNFKSSYCTHSEQDYEKAFIKAGFSLDMFSVQQTTPHYFKSDLDFKNYLRPISSYAQHLSPAKRELFLEECVIHYRKCLGLRLDEALYTSVPTISASCILIPKPDYSKVRFWTAEVDQSNRNNQISCKL